MWCLSVKRPQAIQRLSSPSFIALFRLRGEYETSHQKLFQPIIFYAQPYKFPILVTLAQSKN